MYSDGANYSYSYSVSNNQCGEYTDEGDCYNREHSWPKNWFDGTESSTPGHDLHHIFPTDGYVNSRRSNYPYGEVQTASYTSQNGSKLGTCKSSLGYNGTVFEPIDEYKGDFARAYFYMSVRYYGEDSNWGSSGMTNKSEIEDWAVAMLLAWNEQDPVSQKEINRNNVIYNTYQHNRNPFIDNPDYARQIWDPSWSSTYTIYASANPAIGGDAFILTGSDATVSKDFSTQGYTDGQEIGNVVLNTNTSVTFNKGSNNNAPKYYSSGTAIRCYGGNNFTVSSTSGNISKVVLTYSSGEGTNAITTNVGEFSTDTWTGSAPSVTFTIGGTSGHRRIKAIEVTYSGGSLTPVQQATVASGTTVTLSATPNTGYRFVNWTKGTTVVSANASFNLTVNESATYKANFELDTYTISVAANPTSAGLAYIGNAPSPSTSTTKSIDFSQQGYTNQQVIVSAVIDDYVSVTFNKGTNSNDPKYFSTGSAIRCYGGNYFTVSSTSGSITKIVLTFGSGDGSNAITTDVVTYSNGTWTGSASSVKFTIGGTSGNRRIQKLSVTYTTGGSDPATQATLAYGSTAELTATPNNGYSFVNWTKGGATVSTDPSYSFEVTENADLVANFMNNTVNSDIEVASLTLNGTVTVKSGAKLTVNGPVTQPGGSSITIENTGQFVNNTTGVNATVKKNITAWNASNNTGWNTIATPVNNVTFTDVTNLTNATYNVYRLNETTMMWENSQNSSNSYTSFANGRGYLYRKANNTALEFNGTLNVSTATYPLTYTETGFHIIGNPYPHNIYKGANAAIPNTYLEEGFYTITSAGGFMAGTDNSTVIEPCQAILVQATTNAQGKNLVISKNPAKSTDKDNDDNIMFTVSNSNYEDVAYAVFKKGHGLNKIDHRNEAIQKIYIQHNGEDFAIADIGEDEHSFSLNFHAATTGKYTMKVKPVGNFNYLHLIDAITGEDIDLLLDDEYSFIGSPSDKENRFIVRLRYISVDNFTDEVFAYQSGNEIVVSGNGLLQVYDAIGRMVYNQRVDGFETIRIPSNGVYIFRLIGDEVRTQKIIVK